MSQRKRTTGADNRIFRNTAARSKKINIAPVIMRGGIRL